MSLNINTALLSVSDKTGILDLALFLQAIGVTILSTGGTLRHLTEGGVSATDVSAYTGFPEMMGGRLKTLHPKIHGGILGRRDIDLSTMQSHGIVPIDLVVVNLYDFSGTLARHDSTHEDIIENIDIGGPAMLRSAAKNYKDVIVLTDISDYSYFKAQYLVGEDFSDYQRMRYALKVFSHTSEYDRQIAEYLHTKSRGGEL